MAKAEQRRSHRARARIEAPATGARRLRWGRIVALLLALLVVGAAAYGYRFYVGAGNDLVRRANNVGPFRNRFTLLLLGEGLIQDGNTDITNPNAPDQTDTMMLVSVDPATGQANVLSIPRDTMVNLPQAGGLAKINDANFVGGPQLAVKVVEQTLHIPVNYYMETTIFNFAKMINELGGLRVYVPFNMRYGDAKGKFAFLNIDLTRGWHTLNGYQVLQFVRFRNEALGDIGRIQQQQYIVEQILKKVLSPAYITRLPDIIGQLRQDITHTNLSTGEMLELGALLTHIHIHQVRYATLPGAPTTVNGVSYWVLNRRLLPVLIDDVLLDRLTAQDRATIHIEVETAAGSLAPASRLAAWLTHQGFTVAPAGWSGQTSGPTVIWNYTGDKYLAHLMAQAVGGSAVINNVPYHDISGVDMVIWVGRQFHLDPGVRF